MVVYTKFNTAYKLSRSVRKEPDGTVYDVSGEPGLQVKVFDKKYRTDEMERMVDDAVMGMGMMSVTPIGLVYQNNRFAGYVMNRQAEPEVVSPVTDILPGTPPVTPPERTALPSPGGSLPLLVMIAGGLAGSLLIFFVIFPSLSRSMDSTVAAVNFSGIPMIIGGWILLFIIASKAGGDGWGRTLFGLLGFVLGAALICGALTILVGLFFAVTSVVSAILPTVITIVILVFVFKSILGR